MRSVVGVLCVLVGPITLLVPWPAVKAYFDTWAANIMMWHVPNGKSLVEFKSASIIRYRTTGNQLNTWGNLKVCRWSGMFLLVFHRWNHSFTLAPSNVMCRGILRVQRLFSDYPLISQNYGCQSANGPIMPVTFDLGASTLAENMSPNSRTESTPGAIHFRAVNNERAVNAVRVSCGLVAYIGV